MTARVETADSGFYRAVCKDERCRADNAQRNYWRGPHQSLPNAHALAIAHNHDAHNVLPVCHSCANPAARIVRSNGDEAYRCLSCLGVLA